MSIFDKLFGTQEAVVVPVAPQVFTIPQNKEVRRGMWVVTENGVGILTGDSTVTLVKEDGSTKMIIENDVAVPYTVEVESVVQAFIEDIPQSRQPTLEVLYSLGYKHKG